MLSEWIMVLVGIVLTLGTAVFVAAEFSLVAMDPATVDRRVARGDKRASSIQQALHHLSTELSGAQVGITLTTVLLGYTAQQALVSLLGSPLERTGLAGPAAAGGAVIISLLLVNGFSMLFGELVPKNFAMADPFGVAGYVAPLQRAFTTLLRPLIVAINGQANAILRRFGIEAAEELSGGRSASELAALVRRSAEQGTLDIGTATLLTRSIGIGALSAVDVMTDRTRAQTLPREATAADVVTGAQSTGHSRFPVVGEDDDDVRGLTHVRRAIAVPYERRGDVPVTSTSLMIPAPRVPETMQLAPLLMSLREGGMQMAVVVDEYGGTSGIVTLEDVVEEIVGEVADEHDPRRSAVFSADGTWSVPGVLRPDELSRRTGLLVPAEGPYDTLAGLVMAELGRIPQIGDEVVVGDVQMQVAGMDGRRVERLSIFQRSEQDGGT